jgi:hypothetical protein
MPGAMFRGVAMWYEFWKKLSVVTPRRYPNKMQETAINDALRITAILNKHLEEPNCQHGIKQIVADVLESEINGLMETKAAEESPNARLQVKKFG